eukprot:RCo034603
MPLRRLLPKAVSFWVVLGLMMAIAVAGIFVPPAPFTAPSGTVLDSGDISWLLTASGLVLMMTPGLSFFYGGLVGRSSTISTMLQSVVTMGLIGVLWVVVGFSLAFGDDLAHVIGSPATHPYFLHVGGAPSLNFAPSVPLALFALFQLKFAIITPALISGGFAERVNFQAYLLFVSMWSLVVYCPLAHWVWHPQGFLRRWGGLDFTGGTGVHTTPGFS